MNRTLFLLLMLVLTGCGSNGTSGSHGTSGTQETIRQAVIYKPIAANYTSSSVRSAAEAGLTTFLGALGNSGTWPNFGFLSHDELSSAQVGTPYRDLTIIELGKTSQTIVDNGSWSFPVMVDNQYRCLLTVDKMNGVWEAVSIGSAGAAKWLQDLEQSHPLLDFHKKCLVSSHEPDYSMLMLNPSEQQPLFLLLPISYQIDLLHSSPQYKSWKDTDPMPALSFEELFLLFSAAR